MLTLYLVCLGFGGILLALQMLTGGSDMDHDAGADIDHDLDMHTDVDHSLDIGDGEVDLSTDVDADTSVDLQSDVGHDIHPMHTGTAPEHVQPQDVGDSIKFFSLRTVIFFTAFFGLTGSVLSWMSIAFLPTLLSAVGMGGFASVLTHRLMNYLYRTESGQAVDLKKLEGHTAKVLLDVTKETKGKIVLEVQGQTLRLLAILDSDAEDEVLKAGAWALIVTFDGGIATIIKADFMDE